MAMLECLQYKEPPPPSLSFSHCQSLALLALSLILCSLPIPPDSFKAKSLHNTQQKGVLSCLPLSHPSLMLMCCHRGQVSHSLGKMISKRSKRQSNKTIMQFL